MQHVVELGLFRGERLEDVQPEHEAVEQYVHQHAEADHAEPDHRQHEFERHHAPPCDAAAASSDSSSPTDSGRAAVWPPPCSGGVSSGCGPRRIIFSTSPMPAPKITTEGPDSGVGGELHAGGGE